MYIIPAIDIIEGKCVRLTKGDYNQKTVYNENPIEVAKAFEDHGITKLHLVDLDGAKAQEIKNYQVLEKIAAQTSLEIDFGGGIKSDDSIRIAFDSGAKQVTCGTIAVKQPEMVVKWLQKYGKDAIILGADVLDRKIAIHGWQESSELALIPFLEDYIQKGIQYTICTDISKDGLLQGTALELYAEIRETFDSLHLIASGGITNMDELEALQKTGCYGAIIGKAIYEGHITLTDLASFINKNPVA